MSRARKNDGGETVQSVTRALLLLELLAEKATAVSLSELSQKANLKMATVHRLLTTLMSKGFVEQDSISLRYQLGVKTFQIGNAALFVNDLRSIARPFLKQLLESVNETINLAVLENTEVIYIDQIESTNIVIVKMFAQIGSRGPAYCTGTGKVLLADLSNDEIRKRFSQVDFIQFTENTITNINQLIRALNKIRLDGYALDFSERDPGVTCVAVPIKNFDNRVQAAISVSAPEQRMSIQRINAEILPALTSAAGIISQKLGFTSHR
jgi:DNA-binding IclR family transcriptional regulator